MAAHTQAPVVIISVNIVKNFNECLSVLIVTSAISLPSITEKRDTDQLCLCQWQSGERLNEQKCDHDSCSSSKSSRSHNLSTRSTRYKKILTSKISNDHFFDLHFDWWHQQTCGSSSVGARPPLFASSPPHQTSVNQLNLHQVEQTNLELRNSSNVASRPSDRVPPSRQKPCLAARAGAN